MRKLPAHLDNHIDSLFIAITDAISPALKASGHTPNVLTTYSFGSALLAVTALHHGHVAAFVGLWTLEYFWDCADGHYARKYGMVTKAGDVYDHVTDLVSLAALVVVAHKRYAAPPWIVVGVLALVALNVVHMGCQQKYYGGGSRGGSGESMDSFQRVCPDTSWLRFTRWLSHGTTHLLLVLAVLYMEKYHRRDSPEPTLADPT